MYIVETDNLEGFLNVELKAVEQCKNNKNVVLVVLELDELLNVKIDNDKKEQLRHLIRTRLNHIEKYFYSCYEVSMGSYVFLSSIQTVKDVKQLTGKLISCFSENIDKTNNSIKLTPTVGSAICSDEKTNALVWIQQANADILKSRQMRKSYSQNYALNSLSFNTTKTDTTDITLMEEIVFAIQEGQINIVFQPLWNYSKLKVYGAEALLRWEHPEKGEIPPDLFIPLAEKKVEIISTLERWVIDKVLQNMKTWQDEHKVNVKVFVNISAVHLKNMDIAEYIIDKLASYDVSSEFLGIEITESFLLENNTHVINQLNKLKKNGVTLTLDDFGTGYASFLYLTQFPFDNIKIPQEFVKNIVTQSKLSIIVQSLIKLSKSLNIGIIAEGIETKEQDCHLYELGCENGQGYLYGKPMEEDKFLNHVSQPAI